MNNTDPLGYLVPDRRLMHNKRPRVIIVGAGLGGLTLAMLLEKTDIPYEVIERAPVFKPLGAGIALSPSTAPLFMQCQIYDEFVSLAKRAEIIQVVNEDRETEYCINMTNMEELFGAGGYLISRPMLYDLLLRQIPQERIQLGKKVLSMHQGGNGVLVRCSDGSVINGDILIGADGAYSAVRQGLFRDMKKRGKLPPSDDTPLPFSTVCLVGQTVPLDPAEFPLLGEERCQFVSCIGRKKRYSWTVLTTKQSTVLWRVILYLDNKTKRDNDSFRNSEWGPEVVEAMCDQVRDFPIVSGGTTPLTMGHLINWTPKEFISKVMLEEKVFETWHDCRTVLIGDACHKFNPAGGLGATNAMHDAIVLANLINALPDHPIASEIENAFQAYKDERISWAKEAYNSSKALRDMTATSYKAKMIRLGVKMMPGWAERKLLTPSENRPQCNFLPLITNTGSSPPAAQPSLFAKRPQPDESCGDARDSAAAI
ncbi:hypothetical protein BGZ91_009926 [Linnemannia elongata]|nr:hypothetical protein BGZ91_009926 [Linnemannia elongata]KAG0074493.1 hypothetical protein BGZ90_010707 [Linnemannia elongata]